MVVGLQGVQLVLVSRGLVKIGSFLSISNWCLVFGCLHPVIIDCAICCESTKDLGFGVFKEFGLSGLGLVRFHNEEQ